jgi:hypothetical protein
VLLAFWLLVAHVRNSTIESLYNTGGYGPNMDMYSDMHRNLTPKKDPHYVCVRPIPWHPSLERHDNLVNCGSLLFLTIPYIVL